MSNDTASSTETPAHLTATGLTDQAYDAAKTFAGARPYEGYANILAEMIAGQKLLADRMQLDWKGIQAEAKAILASFAPTKPARAPKPDAIPGETYAIDVTAPDGAVLHDIVAEPYNFAILQRLDGHSSWGIRSRVNSKAVAHSRCNTFRKKGVQKENLVIVPVEGTSWQPAPEGEQAATPATPAKQAKKVKAAKLELVVPEAAPDLTGTNFEFEGSTKVHAPNSSYSGALCGAAKGKDPRQTDADLTCQNCKRLKSLFALAAEQNAAAAA